MDSSDEHSIRWKKCLDALTAEKRAAIQALWDQEKNSLLLRNGDHPKYKNHYIKNNPKLRDLIEQIYEGYMCVFMERAIVERDGFKDDPHQRTDWVVNRFTQLACKRIEATLGREVKSKTNRKEVSGKIIGSIIGRCIFIFSEVFPDYDTTCVSNESIKIYRNLDMPPDKFSR